MRVRPSDQRRAFADMRLDPAEMGDALFGKVVIELFDDDCPRTAKNFRWICSGDKGKGKSGVKVHYKVSRGSASVCCATHRYDAGIAGSSRGTGQGARTCKKGRVHNS